MSLMHRSFFINSSEFVSYLRNRSRRKMPQPSLPMDVFFNSAFPSMSYEWVTPKHRVTVHFFVFVFVSFFIFLFLGFMSHCLCSKNKHQVRIMLRSGFPLILSHVQLMCVRHKSLRTRITMNMIAVLKNFYLEF